MNCQNEEEQMTDFGDKEELKTSLFRGSPSEEIAEV
jgi:hypothetical protein